MLARQPHAIQLMTTSQHTNSDDIIAPYDEITKSKASIRIPERLTGFVRYAETNENGAPDQIHRLHRLSEPIPPNADFVSPIYLLTDEQTILHDKLLADDKRFCVQDYTSIAPKIQTECEKDGRVLYPILIESDTEVPHYEMRAELKQFIREVLEIKPSRGKWFFTGGTSLHVHLPYHVSNETDLIRLRRETKQYNENAKVTVDASNFIKKNLIRLPGAKHHNTGIEKTPISFKFPDKQLQKLIAQLKAGVFEEQSGRITHTVGTTEIRHYSLIEELCLTDDISTPIIEQRDSPIGRKNFKLWKRYNRHPFSPYANTGNGRRSIVVGKVKGGLFCRKKGISGNRQKQTYVPMFVDGAVSADGEFTMWDENAPIQLSEPDREKWDYHDGNIIVLIGGQSRSSRIIQLENSFTRNIIYGILLNDSEEFWTELDGRKNAFEYLEDLGYNTGSAVLNSSDKDSVNTGKESKRSDAFEIQRQAEKGDIESLTHEERLTVANRLLRIRGWDETIDWFQTQYGNRYDEAITRKFLRTLAMKYEDLPSPQ